MSCGFTSLSGAQRLSASEIQHLSQGCFVLGFPLCSTPFGIRDSTHGSTLFTFSTSSCAQRLSASEIQHLRLFLRDVTVTRAQRLSASEIQHVKLRFTICNTKHVLNAFRHQRFNTEYAFYQRHPSVRAQRLSASEIQHIAVALSSVSIP